MFYTSLWLCWAVAWLYLLTIFLNGTPWFLPSAPCYYYHSPLVGSAHQAFLFSFPAAVKYSTVPTKAGALPTWLTLYSQGPVLSAQNSETRLQTTGPAQS